MMPFLIFVLLVSWFLFQFRPKQQKKWDRRWKKMSKVLGPIYNWVASDVRAVKKNYRHWRDREARERAREIAELEKKFYEASGE